MCTICNWHQTLVKLNRIDYTEKYLADVYAREIYTSTPYWRNRMLIEFNRTACDSHKTYVNNLIEAFPEIDRQWEEYIKHARQWQQ